MRRARDASDVGTCGTLVHLPLDYWQPQPWQVSSKHRVYWSGRGVPTTVHKYTHYPSRAMVRAAVLCALCVLGCPLPGNACCHHGGFGSGFGSGLLHLAQRVKTTDEDAGLAASGPGRHKLQRGPPPHPPPAHPPPSVAGGVPGIGDPQPFARLLTNGEIEWHVFFLRSLQSGAWDHLVSRDLFHWEIFYNAVGPANSGDKRYNTSFPWAQLAAYTGSVMEDPATGLYHAFYTAYGGGPSIGRENIVHAVSKDLLTFDLLEDNNTVRECLSAHVSACPFALAGFSSCAECTRGCECLDPAGCVTRWEALSQRVIARFQRLVRVCSATGSVQDRPEREVHDGYGS